ncbi:hypothetical protein E2F43_18490 [Seongchinamella unica]|uniref:Uncharacterized protein n=1 Tax=Seongchinamella unica TaxID=2547392 RepID=A0A4R5LMT3_9GAMM|nr:thrombospondin type 3 repeat-containing protein [Seongchinamella unica]TDG11376.1 hypothetical protein E2F43_18490 [Seongchinamella unica]
MNIPNIRIAAFLGMTFSLLTPHASSLEADPSTSPVPNISELILDSRRGIYIELSVFADGSTQLLGSGVTDLPPGATDDDPPLLLLQFLDASGQIIGVQNGWDPRYEYEQTGTGEQVVLLAEGIGRFQVPFDHRITHIRFLDQQLATPLELVDVDVSDLVQAFCLGNPADDNCTGFETEDRDGDGVIDSEDNCADVANPDQADADGDTIGDACDDSPGGDDSDGDGIVDTRDLCPSTQFPESAPTSGVLGRNRWALDAGGNFVQAPPQEGTEHTFTLSDTRGCSCEQIIAAAGYGSGHLKSGCSTSALINWVQSE